MFFMFLLNWTFELLILGLLAYAFLKQNHNMISVYISVYIIFAYLQNQQGWKKSDLIALTTNMSYLALNYKKKASRDSVSF